jgi:hypothetical protein
MLKIRKAELTDRRELLELLPAAVEENLGLNLSPQPFRVAGEPWSFLLGRGTERRLYLVEFDVAAGEGALERALAHFHRIASQIGEVLRLLPGVAIDPTLPPKLLLFFCSFPPSFLQALLYIDRQLDVEIYRLQCVEAHGERGLMIEREPLERLRPARVERAEPSASRRPDATDCGDVPLTPQEIYYFLAETNDPAAR